MNQNKATLTLCLLGNIAYLIFFSKSTFSKKIFREYHPKVSHNLDPDQARQKVVPELGPNCLQGPPADDTSRQKVYSISSISVINSSSFNFVTFIVN